MKAESPNEAIAAIAERRTQSLTAIVRRELERMIVSGEIASGERLNEQLLANRLGVSRGPVREATRGLEMAGLVTAVANQGVFVRELSRQEAADLYDLREVIFDYACRRLAASADGQAAHALQAMVERMEAAVERVEPGEESYYALNLRFHDLVMDLAGSRRAASIYASLVKESHLFRQRSLDREPNRRESNDEHRAMVEAIAAGDAKVAGEVARRHHRNGKRRWLETTGD